MNYKIYKIISINELTNRKKSIKVNEITEEAAIQAALHNGLKDISSIEIIPHEPATERQLDYAKSLGIPIPLDPTKEDLSALISKKLDRDGTPNEGLLEFATNKRIFLSTYIGKTALYDSIFYNLKTDDRIAFFIYCIYRYISDDRHANLDTHPNKDMFYSFVEVVGNDERFLKSMNRYSGSDLKFFGTFTAPDGCSYTGGSVDTIAFKTAREYLIEHGLIKESDNYRTKTMKPTYREESTYAQSVEAISIAPNVAKAVYANEVEVPKPKFDIPKYELPVVIFILILLALYIFIF